MTMNPTATSDDRVVLSQALDPLVLAIDVGSTASRGDVFDAAGRPVQGGRRKIPHQFTTGGEGRWSRSSRPWPQTSWPDE